MGFTLKLGVDLGKKVPDPVIMRGMEKEYVYLDAAASSSSDAFYCADNFANPNAIHEAGRDAFAILESARENFARIIGAKRPSEII